MSVFEPVTLNWKGSEYKVESDKVMMLIAKIEEIITLSEVYNYAQKGAAPVAKISMAYGAALRYAGCSIRDDEVYQGLFSGGNEQDTIPAALNALLSMMIPPEDLRGKGNPDGKEPQGKVQADSGS